MVFISNGQYLAQVSYLLGKALMNYTVLLKNLFLFSIFVSIKDLSFEHKLNTAEQVTVIYFYLSYYLLNKDGQLDAAFTEQLVHAIFYVFLQLK